jgi:cysteine-rich repeat protein/parallel beta-helix repeat protein
MRLSRADYNTINGNTITGSFQGIYISYQSDFNDVTDNTLINNANYGVSLSDDSTNNDLFSNVVCSSTGTDIRDDDGNQGTADDDENTCDTTVTWNDLGTTGCTYDCTSVAYCGDGVVQSPNDMGQDEECDDGNTANEDGCDENCIREVTGIPTETGTDVTVSDEDTGVDITFSEVTGEGYTSISIAGSGPPPPSGFMLTSDPPEYLDISTDAVYVGDVTICMGYDEDNVIGPEENLALMHWDGSTWTNTTDYPVNTLDNIICCTTSGFSLFTVMERVTGELNADVDFDPDTLNRKSKGKWVTVYIELPEGYDAADIDILSLTVNGIPTSEDLPSAIGDYDEDGVADLMVKFDRSAVQEILEPGDEVVTTVIGELMDGTSFDGTDTIRVIEP